MLDHLTEGFYNLTLKLANASHVMKSLNRILSFNQRGGNCWRRERYIPVLQMKLFLGDRLDYPSATAANHQSLI